MALTYSPVEIRGKAADPVFAELFFKNKTISEGLVAFETDVKANTIFTENDNTVALQAYSSGAPSSSGDLGLTDTEITPAKVMSYIEFDPETLRPSRFNKDMAAGAWNIMSNDFERTVLATYAGQVSAAAEGQFWNGMKSATKSAIALLTGDTTTQERAWAASNADATSQFDGVISKLVLAHNRSSVSGTSITSSNIATEYGKLYADMDAELLDAFEAPVIYAPRSHRQLINIYNSNATYRDLFSKEGDKYFYNGVEIRFVPVYENIMLATLPSFVVWCTDLASDFSELKIDKIANNREDMFVKTIFTVDSFIANQANASLYVG